jgi:lipoyl(octanoyl) transferase
MDLAPFSNIDPCGFEDLVVTQLRDLGVRMPISEVQDRLNTRLQALLTHPAIAMR